MMYVSEKGLDFTSTQEGFVGKYYIDATGTATIGPGATWGSEAFRTWWHANRDGDFRPGATMTRAESRQVLRVLMDEEYGKAVNAFLGDVPVAQYVFDAMADMAYNLGPGALQWRWAAAIKRRDYVNAAALIRITGTISKGVKLRDLVYRRKETADLMLHADYTIAGKVVPAGDALMRKGSRGDNVKRLQSQLSAILLYKGAIDGIFGHGTEAAVLDFQLSRELKADGIAGPKTLSALTMAPIPSPPATNWFVALILAFFNWLAGVAK